MPSLRHLHSKAHQGYLSKVCQARYYSDDLSLNPAQAYNCYSVSKICLKIRDLISVNTKKWFLSIALVSPLLGDLVRRS